MYKFTGQQQKIIITVPYFQVTSVPSWCRGTRIEPTTAFLIGHSIRHPKSFHLPERRLQRRVCYCTLHCASKRTGQTSLALYFQQQNRQKTDTHSNGVEQVANASSTSCPTENSLQWDKKQCRGNAFGTLMQSLDKHRQLLPYAATHKNRRFIQFGMIRNKLRIRGLNLDRLQPVINSCCGVVGWLFVIFLIPCNLP